MQVLDATLNALEPRMLLHGDYSTAPEAPVLDAPTTVHSADRYWGLLETMPLSPTGRSFLDAAGFAPYQLDESALARKLNAAPTEFTSAARTQPLEISLPTPDGRLARFNVVETVVMEPGLAAQFPSFKVYAGVGLDDPSADVRITVTSLGLSASVLAGETSFYVERFYHQQDGLYASYYRRDAHSAMLDAVLEHVEHAANETVPAARGGENVPTGNLLRTYRLAVAATGEFTEFFGGIVEEAQAAIVTSVARLNQIFEKELTIRLSLVANNSSIVFPNAASDPYTNLADSSQLAANQSTIDGIIGDANYDIGHLITTASLANLATLGSVGGMNKAHGISGEIVPIGDPFVVDLMARTIGRQFGANDTYANCGGVNPNSTVDVEPGSGSTIMAHAGRCGLGFNLQNNSDPIFHSVSYDEIINFVDNVIPAVGIRAETGNTAPTVNAGLDYTIPANTPYALVATGGDIDGDTVTFLWEQRDQANGATPVNNTGASGPQVRVFTPSTNPVRTIPRLSNLLNNTMAIGEVLSNETRLLNFRVTGRDNRIGGGGLNSDDMLLTVVDTGSAFSVTSFNSGINQLPGGSMQTLTWNVAGTNGAGINATNVKISMSTDGGNTFSTVLHASTPNDGTEEILIPSITSNLVRFKVEGVGNIFFDINNVNVQITGVSATPGVPDLAAATDTGVSDSDNITRFNNSTFATRLTFTVGGTVNGANVQIFSSGVLIGQQGATGTSTTVTTNGTTALLDGLRSITARQTEPGKSQSPDSGALAITIDTVAPTLSSSLFNFETGHSIDFTFSDSVGASAAGADFTVMNLTSGQTILPANQAIAPNPDGTVVTLSFPGVSGPPAGILADGNYTAAINPDAITDVAGNPVSASPAGFFVFAGDANRDRAIDIGDFSTLATRFNLTGTFSQADFNYDGITDIGDFAILASKFNRMLPAPASAARPALPAAWAGTAQLEEATAHFWREGSHRDIL